MVLKNPPFSFVLLLLLYHTLQGRLPVDIIVFYYHLNCFFYLVISQKYQYYPVSILVVFLLHNSIISLNVSTKVEWLLSQYRITDLFSILLFSILGFKQGFGWIGNGKHNQLDPFEVNFTCVSQFCFRTCQFYF